MSSSDEDVPLAARFRKAPPAGSSRGAAAAARAAGGRGRGGGAPAAGHRGSASPRGGGRGRGAAKRKARGDGEPPSSPEADGADGGSPSASGDHAPPRSAGGKGKAEGGGAGKRKGAGGDEEATAASGDGKDITDAPVVELPVVIPERVAGSRMLLELVSSDPSASEVDFSGDMGVIGRAAAVTLPDGEQSLQLDLKGVIYGTSRIQTPGTLVLLSLGVAEAKVEGLLNEVTQLRELTRDADSIDDAALQKLIGNDDADDGFAQAPLPGAKAVSDGKAPGASKPKARGGGAARGKGTRRAPKKQRK